ncbi:MAG TPA: NAD(P)/FAD-dependent oxidoreductase [Brevundimonas sp.]|jgi:NADH dehydrogenase|uniref:NAD(P)/FAD-dependent oxidoreductase n=1 Tax=Brevundimonas sp. TaxID=1871086 RepID=UPI002DE8CC86|nr:NAD(P)/FAD-dependent oxidoreductase [Brevundimonas sp.]
MDSSQGRRPRVVIVGAGFGGLAAARALRRAEAEIFLIDRTNHHLFQPLLYQVATAVLSPADVATAVRPLLRPQRNTTMLMAEVTRVDTEARLVRLAGDATLPYDWLILATGADYSFFGRPELAQHVHVLKTLSDALTVREKLLTAFEQAELAPDEDAVRRLTTFVVVGGGPTGVEIAGTVAEMVRTTLRCDFRRIDPTRSRVLLFEEGPRVLSAFPQHLSDYACRALSDLGVEVRPGTAVETIGDGWVQVGGERIEAALTFWCAGVQARPAARWLGVPQARNGGVVVGPDCSAPGLPEVFVVGDVSHHAHEGGPLPALAPVARQQGRWVGRLIARRIAGRPDPVPFRYRDWGTMAVIGRSRAVALLGGRRLKGVPAWLTWSLVHLMLLIDFRSRATVYVNWTWAWFTRGGGPG